MLQNDSLSSYLFIGDVDQSKLERLHSLVVKFRDSFLDNHPLQNLLLNHGYEPEDRPISYHNVHNSVFNRTLTSVMLHYLDHMVDLATMPQVVQVTTPLIVIPEIGGDYTDSLEVRTLAGHDAGKVELLQTQWFEQTDVVEVVREYQGTLQIAFDEFNSQFMLNLMRQSRLDLTHECEESRLQDRIRDAFMPSIRETHNPLDNVYYEAGCRALQTASPLWKRLNETEFGRFFILQQDEVEKGMRLIRSPANVSI